MRHGLVAPRTHDLAGLRVVPGHVPIKAGEIIGLHVADHAHVDGRGGHRVDHGADVGPGGLCGVLGHDDLFRPI